MGMQLNLQFGNIHLGTLVHSPSLAQAGQFECVPLILELQLFLQLTNIQSGFFVVFTSLGPVWALILMSTAISTHPTKDCRFRDHWRPWVCFGCCCSYENVFSTFTFSIKSRTRVPFRVLQSRHSDANFPLIP